MSEQHSFDRLGPVENRRGFLTLISQIAMGTGLFAAYGTLAGFMGRFLYPARPDRRGWQVVTDVKGIETGESFVYRMPDGTPVSVTRRASSGEASDFIALSNTCPHLGCQVHWESHNQRFFCPCHNGVFDPEGVATEGPPAEAGQRLAAFPLKVASGVLFIEVPLERLARGKGRLEGPFARPLHSGGGRDPCLSKQTRRARNS